jgi:hypothetical protein
VTDSEAKKARYAALLVVALLGFGTSGLFVVAALDAPEVLGGWLLLTGWLLIFVICFVLAWRRYRRMP